MTYVLSETSITCGTIKGVKYADKQELRDEVLTIFCCSLSRVRKVDLKYSYEVWEVRLFKDHASLGS